MEEKKKIPDYEIIAEWRMMLKIFEGVMDLKQDQEAKEQYEQLYQMAKDSKFLTPRQKNGITDRCNYRISLIDNPTKVPFANAERLEKRNAYQLSNTESNGKS